MSRVFVSWHKKQANCFLEPTADYCTGLIRLMEIGCAVVLVVCYRSVTDLSSIPHCSVIDLLPICYRFTVHALYSHLMSICQYDTWVEQWFLIEVDLCVSPILCRQSIVLRQDCIHCAFFETMDSSYSAIEKRSTISLSCET